MMNLKDWIATAIAIASLAINWLALRKSLPIQEEPEPEDPPGLLRVLKPRGWNLWASLNLDLYFRRYYQIQDLLKLL